MRTILNHSKLDTVTHKGQGIGIVNKDMHPTYRKAEAERSLATEFDTVIQAGLLKTDTILQNQINKLNSMAPDLGDSTPKNQGVKRLFDTGRSQHSFFDGPSHGLAQAYRSNMETKHRAPKDYSQISKYRTNSSQLSDVLQFNHSSKPEGGKQSIAPLTSRNISTGPSAQAKTNFLSPNYRATLST